MEFNLSAGLFSEEQKFESFQEQEVYDTIIIGAGPAGLTAAVYCMRKGLKTGLMTKQVGGQVADTAGIENYLGYRYINGTELVDKFREQVMQFSIAFESDSPVQSLQDGKIKEIVLEDGRSLKARTLIIASGKQSKMLGIPGEDRLIGHGVAYCAICDAPFFVDKKVVVVGGGNSGVEAAIDLAKVATHVTLIQRREHLTADKILIEKLSDFSNVTYLYNHIVTEILGKNDVDSVMIQNKRSQQISELKADGIFIQIGLIPNSSFAHGLLDMNEYNEILINGYCQTNRDGIFAAGDVTSVPYKQIIIACGEGAKAALAATTYLLNLPKE